MKKSITLLFACFCFLSCNETIQLDGGKNTEMTMTIREGFHYANKSQPSQIPFTVIGIVLIVCSLSFVVYKIAKDPEFFNGSNKIGIIALLAVAGGLAFILAKPIAVSRNNTKIIPTEHYEKVGRKHLYDSLFKNHRMVNANSKY